MSVVPAHSERMYTSKLVEGMFRLNRVIPCVVSDDELERSCAKIMRRLAITETPPGK
jgi:hypothetical protein